VALSIVATSGHVPRLFSLEKALTVTDLGLMQKNGSQLPASHFVLKKRVPISAWEQQEQQVLFLQEQQVRQQEQQVQESAWKSADPLPEQQVQQQELLL